MSFAEQMISLELHPRTLYILQFYRNQIQNCTVWQYFRKVAQNTINYLEPEIVESTKDKKSHDAFSESWESTCFNDNVF